MLGPHYRLWRTSPVCDKRDDIIVDVNERDTAKIFEIAIVVAETTNFTTILFVELKRNGVMVFVVWRSLLLGILSCVLRKVLLTRKTGVLRFWC